MRRKYVTFSHGSTHFWGDKRYLFFCISISPGIGYGVSFLIRLLLQLLYVGVIGIWKPQGSQNKWNRLVVIASEKKLANCRKKWTRFIASSSSSS